MTRTVIRPRLSALAVLVLVSAFAASPASAQGWDYGNTIRGTLFPPVQAGRAAEGPKGLAAKKHSQRSKSISDPGVRKALSLSDEQ
jgi:hypothetical protein